MIDASNRRKPPTQSRLKGAHLWVDWVELVALANPDGLLARADIADLLSERRDLVSDEPQDGGDQKASDDLFEDEDFDTAFLLQPTTGARAPGTFDPQLPGANDEVNYGDWFSHMVYRQEAFGTHYPFTLSGDRVRVRTDIEDHDECLLYVFLLLASNLRCISSKDRLYWTERFEVVCTSAVRAALPLACVHMFGVNSLNTGRYTGSAEGRIRKAAEDLGESVTGTFEAATKTRTGTDLTRPGDGGIDILAWLPMGDFQNRRLTILGQCGCDQDWKPKQLEAHPVFSGNYIDFRTKPVAMFFTPQCYRSPGGEWANPMVISEVVFIDRLRLVRMLTGNLDVFRTERLFTDAVLDALRAKEYLTSST